MPPPKLRFLTISELKLTSKKKKIAFKIVSPLGRSTSLIFSPGTCLTRPGLFDSGHSLQLFYFYVWSRKGRTISLNIWVSSEPRNSLYGPEVRYPPPPPLMSDDIDLLSSTILSLLDVVYVDHSWVSQPQLVSRLLFKCIYRRRNMGPNICVCIIFDAVYPRCHNKILSANTRRSLNVMMSTVYDVGPALK